MVAIVEDDASMRESLGALVRSLGYATSIFSSAEDYLDSDCIDVTDCLITDIRMAGLSGLELHEQLMCEGRKFPTIFITAYFDDETKDRVLDAGAVGLLSKPFKDYHLIACLDEALAR